VLMLPGFSTACPTPPVRRELRVGGTEGAGGAFAMNADDRASAVCSTLVMLCATSERTGGVRRGANPPLVCEHLSDAAREHLPLHQAKFAAAAMPRSTRDFKT
jgi:hypothetical protein